MNNTNIITNENFEIFKKYNTIPDFANLKTKYELLQYRINKITSKYNKSIEIINNTSTMYTKKSREIINDGIYKKIPIYYFSSFFNYNITENELQELFKFLANKKLISNYIGKEVINNIEYFIFEIEKGMVFKITDIPEFRDFYDIDHLVDIFKKNITEETKIFFQDKNLIVDWNSFNIEDLVFTKDGIKIHDLKKLNLLKSHPLDNLQLKYFYNQESKYINSNYYIDTEEYKNIILTYFKENIYHEKLKSYFKKYTIDEILEFNIQWWKSFKTFNKEEIIDGKKIIFFNTIDYEKLNQFMSNKKILNKQLNYFEEFLQEDNIILLENINSLYLGYLPITLDKIPLIPERVIKIKE